MKRNTLKIILFLILSVCSFSINYDEYLRKELTDFVVRKNSIDTFFQGKKALEEMAPINEIEALFFKAIELDKRNYMAYQYLGTEALIHDRDKNKSIEYYKKSLKINPKNFEIYLNMGYIYEEERNYEMAFKEYEKLKKIVPNSPESYYAAASLNFKLGKFSNMLNDAQKALKLYESPSYNLDMKEKYIMDAQFLILVSFFEQEKYEEALNYFFIVGPNMKKNNFDSFPKLLNVATEVINTKLESKNKKIYEEKLKKIKR